MKTNIYVDNESERRLIKKFDDGSEELEIYNKNNDIIYRKIDTNGYIYQVFYEYDINNNLVYVYDSENNGRKFIYKNSSVYVIDKDGYTDEFSNNCDMIGGEFD